MSNLAKNQPSFFVAFFFAFAHRAALAFLASAVRCSPLICSILAGPPFFPPREPCSLKYSSTSGGSFFTGALPYEA